MSSTFLDRSLITKQFTFPDGQPHLVRSADEPDRVRVRITDAASLFEVCLYDDTRTKPYHLEIVYLMGARMDKRNSPESPLTLEVISRILRTLVNASAISVHCPHSGKVWVLPRYTEEPELLMAESTFYDMAVLETLNAQPGAIPQDARARHRPVTLVLPDAGAMDRMKDSPLFGWHPNAKTVVCSKVRDLETGRITRFDLDGVPGEVCVILDDLCDGGATFRLAASALREAGARYVSLAVYHGIFSAGLPLEGIDKVFSTASWSNESATWTLPLLPVMRADYHRVLNQFT